MCTVENVVGFSVASTLCAGGGGGGGGLEASVCHYHLSVTVCERVRAWVCACVYVSHVCVYVCAHACLSVSQCVCVFERERERECVCELDFLCRREVCHKSCTDQGRTYCIQIDGRRPAVSVVYRNLLRFWTSSRLSQSHYNGVRRVTTSHETHCLLLNHFSLSFLMTPGGRPKLQPFFLFFFFFFSFFFFF